MRRFLTQSTDGHGCRQCGWYNDGYEIKGLKGNVAAGNAAQCLCDDGVNDADARNAGQKLDEPVRVLLELEVDRRRVHDRTHQAALARIEACANDYGEYLKE